MQKFITKYGLAAHLGLLTVAPLFLFPLVGGGAPAFLWLTMIAAWWVALSPSKRVGEMVHCARERVWRETLRDPFTWVLVILSLFLALRWINSGLALSYDSEAGKWDLTGSLTGFFPCGMAGTGMIPFVVSLGALVVLVAVRHSLGRSARAAYLLSISSFSGLAGIVASTGVIQGWDRVTALASCTYASPSFIGSAFAVCVMAGIVAFAEAITRPIWHRILPLGALLLGGSITGTVFFSPPSTVAWLAVVALITFVFAFVTAGREAGASATFRGLIVFAFAFIVPVLFIGCWAPRDFLAEHLGAMTSGRLFPEGFERIRAILADVASRAWNENPWMGSGVGVFGVEINRLASEADRELLPPLQAGIPFGWWRLLAERGIVGTLALAIPFGYLLVSYVVRAVVGWRQLPLNPSAILLPMAYLFVVVSGLMDESNLRTDVLLLAGACAAVSTCAFPVMRRDETELNNEEGGGNGR